MKEFKPTVAEFREWIMQRDGYETRGICLHFEDYIFLRYCKNTDCEICREKTGCFVMYDLFPKLKNQIDIMCNSLCSDVAFRKMADRKEFIDNQMLKYEND